jgi:hydroxymethylbilane synthase
MSAAVLRLGSRRTPLALAQTAIVVDQLRAVAPELVIEVVEISTGGDVDPALPLGPGIFVAELRAAVLDGRIDAAVHSLKDLPTGGTHGLVLAAVPVRDDPREVLVTTDGRSLDALPSGARIGTSSPRRFAAITAMDLGLEVVPMRGSIGTRLDKLDRGDAEALLLARAGLARLDLLSRVTDTIDPGRILPAAGQGALAVECRSDDRPTHDLLRRIDDPFARAATDAERALLSALDAGCTHPIGALAEPAEGDDGQTELYLRAVVHAADGSSQVRLSTTGPLTDADEIGRSLARELVAAGADALLER